VGNGPLLETHKALACSLGIEGAVSFVGNVAHDAVAGFFDNCSLFVLPSRAEPFGLVLLEAAFHQKGLVCTRVGGVPEIIADNENGLLVEPDDPTRLAAKVIELLRDPERAHALGAAAHQTLMTRFLWKDRIHDYIAVYEGRRDDSPVAFAAATSTASRQAAPAPKIG
jgi:glycosyltransferase involved in cell wall biosynthesis